MIIYTLYYSGCFFAVHFLVLFSCYSRFRCAFGYVNGKVKLFFSALCFCPFHAASLFQFCCTLYFKNKLVKRTEELVNQSLHIYLHITPWHHCLIPKPNFVNWVGKLRCWFRLGYGVLPWWRSVWYSSFMALYKTLPCDFLFFSFLYKRIYLFKKM